MKPPDAFAAACHDRDIDAAHDRTTIQMANREIVSILDHHRDIDALNGCLCCPAMIKVATGDVASTVHRYGKIQPLNERLTRKTTIDMAGRIFAIACDDGAFHASDELFARLARSPLSSIFVRVPASKSASQYPSSSEICA
jgi:imidazoleglycerol phosphate dehydratase HisB